MDDDPNWPSCVAGARSVNTGRPEFLIDQSSGECYLAYVRSDPATGYARVYFRRTQGGSWLAPTTFPPRQASDQWAFSMAILHGLNVEVGISWHENDFADLSQTAIGAAISNDGGASWTNGQLSSVSRSMNAVTGNSVTWEGMAGIRLSGPFIAGWTDGRAGGYPTMYAGKFAP